MTYKEFKAEYKNLFIQMNKYTLQQAGSQHFLEKMIDIAEKFPDFAEDYENEVEIEAYGQAR